MWPDRLPARTGGLPSTPKAPRPTGGTGGSGGGRVDHGGRAAHCSRGRRASRAALLAAGARSEEHTSELQSLAYLVCRLLLEKKKKKIKRDYICNVHT